LFAKADAEARWHGWQITERFRGLARTYRDPRFATLRFERDIQDAPEVPEGCPLNGDR
jgi:hypothetical protein